MCIYIWYMCRWICLPANGRSTRILQKTLKSVTEIVCHFKKGVKFTLKIFTDIPYNISETRNESIYA